MLIVVISISYTPTLIDEAVKHSEDYDKIDIVSDSMTPTFDENDYLIIREVESVDSVEQGDIVTFKSPCPIEQKIDLVTHRVVGENEHGLVTKGDNVSNPDQVILSEYYNPENQATVKKCHPYLTDENIVGVVEYHSNKNTDFEMLMKIITELNI